VLNVISWWCLDTVGALDVTAVSSRDGSKQSHQAFRYSVASIVVSACAFPTGAMSLFALLKVLAAPIFVIWPIIERAIDLESR
jgi:hypothetical protein